MLTALGQPTGLAAAAVPAAHRLAAAGSGPSVLWYATRATGVTALVLLTITVALGIAGVSRLESRQWPRVITAGLHKNLSLLVVAFVVVHVLTTVLDSFVSISITAAVIPFSSGYRTFWLGLGAIAFDLILALWIPSLLRGRLSYRAWRGIHLLAYVSWPVALWHGLGTGTDSKLPWLLAGRRVRPARRRRAVVAAAVHAAGHRPEVRGGGRRRRSDGDHRVRHRRTAAGRLGGAGRHAGRAARWRQRRDQCRPGRDHRHPGRMDTADRTCLRYQ